MRNLFRIITVLNRTPKLTYSIPNRTEKEVERITMIEMLSCIRLETSKR